MNFQELVERLEKRVQEKEDLEDAVICLIEDWRRDDTEITLSQAAIRIAEVIGMNMCETHPGTALIAGRCGLCTVVPTPDYCAHCGGRITGRWSGPLTGPGLRGGPKYHSEVDECREAGDRHSRDVSQKLTQEQKAWESRMKSTEEAQ